MEQQSTLNRQMTPPAIKLVNDGITNAIAGLAGMVGQNIEVTSLGFKKILVKDVPDMFGGPEALMIGVYLEVNGSSDGHMMVAYQPETAFQLIDLMMGQSTGTTHDLAEMEESVLAEVGNIMGSFFLNSLSDNMGKRLMPSPPAVMMDMAGAVLDVILAQLMQQGDETFIVESSFGTQDKQINGRFLVMPSPGLLDNAGV